VIAVVGAGAAGLATAIFAARRGATGPIVVLDGAARIGAKILVSGGGRCNVTNTVVTERDFRGGSRHVVRRVLRAFPAEAAVEFFREIGVVLHEEEDGKLFPDSNRAKTVLAALVGEAEKRGVAIRPGHRVAGVACEGAGFRLATSRGDVAADAVVLATGGLSLPKTGSDGGGYALAEALGHTLTPRTPALAPLVLDGAFHSRLAGVSQEAELTIHSRPRVRQGGALLWTHFGISGPAALDASRFWHHATLPGERVRVTASLLPGRDWAAVESALLSAARESPHRALKSALAAWLPAAVAAAVPEALGIDPDSRLGRLSRESRRTLVQRLLEWDLPVRDSRGWNFAEATAGGVRLDEVEPATMASRRCPGLFLTGEMLDVDGRLGGFNFQWAWSSGWASARGLGEERGATVLVSRR
jgi:predicted Rossmann fold flavoprotein